MEKESFLIPNISCKHCVILEDPVFLDAEAQ